MARAGPSIATHATPTARDFFRANFYSPGPFKFQLLFFFSLPQNLSRVFPVLSVANTSSCVGPQSKIGHPAHCYTQLMQVPVLRARGIQIGCETCVSAFLGWHFEIIDVILNLRERLVCSSKIYDVCCVVSIPL